MADAVFTRQPDQRRQWMQDAAHRLKHEYAGPPLVLAEMQQFLGQPMSKERSKQVAQAVTYFTNNKSLMNYAAHVERNLPIGSGVTEAACPPGRVIIKQRLCSSGMRWKKDGAAAVLTLRTLSYSTDRWGQFWQKVDQYGFSMAA